MIAKSSPYNTGDHQGPLRGTEKERRWCAVTLCLNRHNDRDPSILTQHGPDGMFVAVIDDQSMVPGQAEVQFFSARSAFDGFRLMGTVVLLVLPWANRPNGGGA